MAVRGRRMRRLAVVALSLSLATRASAGTIEGVTFADRLAVKDQPFVLASMALLRYRVVFRGYVAALYVAPDAPPESVLAADAPKRLEIEYFWAIAAADIVEAGNRCIARNVKPGDLAPLRTRLDQLNAQYVDVKPGDRYAITYLPGRGLELTLNGQPRGAPIPGADVAGAVFGIWFGREPFDPGLKRDLLKLS